MDENPQESPRAAPEAPRRAKPSDFFRPPTAFELVIIVAIALIAAALFLIPPLE